MNWIPGQSYNLESKWVLQHYELDLDSAWQINRIRFFRPVCGQMEINKMRMTMVQEQVSVSGTHFKTPDAGNCVILTHPRPGRIISFISMNSSRKQPILAASMITLWSILPAILK